MRNDDTGTSKACKLYYILHSRSRLYMREDKEVKYSESLRICKLSLPQLTNRQLYWEVLCFAY